MDSRICFPRRRVVLMVKVPRGWLLLRSARFRPCKGNASFSHARLSRTVSPEPKSRHAREQWGPDTARHPRRRDAPPLPYPPANKSPRTGLRATAGWTCQTWELVAFQHYLFGRYQTKTDNCLQLPPVKMAATTLQCFKGAKYSEEDCILLIQ